MNMTAKQMIPAIGQCISARFEELAVECTVQDVKQSYGRVRLLVAPVSGTGNQWIELQRITGPQPTTNTLQVRG